METKEYRIVGAFDTETSNFKDLISAQFAIPILYQFGILKTRIKDITSDNVKKLVEVKMFRHSKELYTFLDEFIARDRSFIPVCMVHNLGFDMYALAPWLRAKNVRVLAKTSKKPISFQVLNENEQPILVFLDTLGLFHKSLKTLGEECNAPKLMGSWDYMLARTPKTKLTDKELEYAAGDIYTLICYMSYFLKQNPDIKQSDIGYKVQTKTGIVRAKRMHHLGNVKGKNARLNVCQYWHLQNKSQKPISDDELFTMHAATRGGFTFCARNNASKVFSADDEKLIYSYDATSQHPAQMVTHLYPEKFYLADTEELQLAANTIINTTLKRVLKYWHKPFQSAFYACFEFKNLRPKKNTIFSREGIFSLASARVKQEFIFDNSNSEFLQYGGFLGYKDSVLNGVFLFGKLESADSARLYITELDLWIISRIYDFDSCKVVGGYISHTFRKPNDFSVLSVMRFYNAKNALKDFKARYISGAKNDASILKGLYPDSFVNDCEIGHANALDIKEYYMLAKADLNSLFGIEATNECRRDYVIGNENIELEGVDGLHNMPKNPKCNYQYGQRIVGWSRVAQVCVMELIAPYVTNVICGDTDSLKVYFPANNLNKITQQLKKYNDALDNSKKCVLRRAKAAYPALYDSLDGIGYYVFDGSYDAFSASWNKCYIGLVNNKCKCTIAGVPTSRRSEFAHDSLNDFCDSLMQNSWSFEDVASLIIGYNVTIDYSITKLNARFHPKKFGEYIKTLCTDYKGDSVMVEEPHVLALFPSVKTIGDTTNLDNARNAEIALINNPNINIKPAWIKWLDGKAIIER